MEDDCLVYGEEVYGQQKGAAGAPAYLETQLAGGGLPGAWTLVSFAEGAKPPCAVPLGRQICVGGEERGYIYSCVHEGGLLWKCAGPSVVGERRGWREAGTLETGRVFL